MIWRIQIASALLAPCLVVAGSTGASHAQETIEVWAQYAPGTANTRERATAYIVDSFAERYPDIEVNITTHSWQTISASLLRAVQAGTAPDLAMLYSPDMPVHVEARTIQPLTDYLTGIPDAMDDIVHLPQAQDTEGTIYGLPWELRVSGLAYRGDLLEAAGKSPPKTLEEWSDTAAVAADAAGGNVIGISLNFSPQGSSIAGAWFVTTLVGMGEEVLNEDGTAAFATPGGEQLVTWLHDQVHKVEPPVLPLDVAMLDLDRGQDLFISGQAVYLPTSTQRFTLVKDRTEFGEHLQMTAYPTDDPNTPAPALVQSWSLVIPVGSKNSDGAAKLMEHWVSKEVQVEQAKIAGYVPVRNSALEDPHFQQPDAESVRWAMDHVAKNPLDFTFPTNTSALYDTLARMFGHVLSGEMEPMEALVWAEEDFNRVAAR